jgi:hypothetical protein
MAFIDLRGVGGFEGLSLEGLERGEFDKALRTLVKDFDLSVEETSRRVTLTIPENTTFRDAIARFQLAVFSLREEFAVRPGTLKRWADDPRFEGALPPNRRLSLEVVPDSAVMTRELQEQRGFNDVSIAELALADAAFMLVTGKHLVSGGSVRGSNGTVRAIEGGLREDPNDDGERHTDMFASRRVPCI